MSSCASGVWTFGAGDVVVAKQLPGRTADKARARPQVPFFSPQVKEAGETLASCRRARPGSPGQRPGPRLEPVWPPALRAGRRAARGGGHVAAAGRVAALRRAQQVALWAAAGAPPELRNTRPFPGPFYPLGCAVKPLRQAGHSSTRLVQTEVMWYSNIHGHQLRIRAAHARCCTNASSWLCLQRAYSQNVREKLT